MTVFVCFDDFHFRLSGRGLKSQPPKTVLPPRFQRQQQQHHQPHQGYDDSYVEVPHHTTVFRRRGSGRRSGDGDDTSDDRLWRRDSDVENGTEPDREQDLQVRLVLTDKLKLPKLATISIENVQFKDWTVSRSKVS